MFSLLDNYIPLRKRIKKDNYLYDNFTFENKKFKHKIYPFLSYRERITSFKVSLFFSNVSLVKFFLKKGYIIRKEEQEFLILSNNPFLLDFIPSNVMFEILDFKSFLFSLEVKSYNFARNFLESKGGRNYKRKLTEKIYSYIDAEGLIFLSNYINDKGILEGTIFPLQEDLKKKIKHDELMLKTIIAMNLNSHFVLSSIFETLKEKNIPYFFFADNISKFKDEFIYRKYLEKEKCILISNLNIAINNFVKNKNIFLLKYVQKIKGFLGVEIEKFCYNEDYREVIEFLIINRAILSNGLLSELFCHEEFYLFELYLSKNPFFFHTQQLDPVHVLNERHFQYLEKNKKQLNRNFILMCLIKYGYPSIIERFSNLFSDVNNNLLLKDVIRQRNLAFFLDIIKNRKRFTNLNLKIIEEDDVAYTSVEIYNILKNFVSFNKRAILDKALESNNLDLAREIIIQEKIEPKLVSINLIASLK